MKTSLKSTIAFAGLFAILASGKAFAQASATVIGMANIVTPISIAKTSDLSFGNAAASPNTAGTIILSPASVRASTGGVTLPATTGTVSAATFTVCGQNNYTYAIMLPTAPVMLLNGSNMMAASNFTSLPSGTGLLQTGGTQILRVGATLNVAAAQPAGTYITTTPFSVTVNYN